MRELVVDHGERGAVLEIKVFPTIYFAHRQQPEDAPTFRHVGNAQPGDLVLLTGKGCEPWICVAGGQKLAWDERVAAEQGIREVMEERDVR